MTSSLVEAPENPFKTLRAASGLSHDKLAALMHVNRMALIRLEQGLFDKPLPSAMEFWSGPTGRKLLTGKNLEFSEFSLEQAYLYFQEQTRDQNRHYFGEYLGEHSYAAHYFDHPLIRLIEQSPTDSVVGVAKALCVPQASLNSWLRKWRNHKTVPKTFQTALLAIGYTRQEVHAFNEGYAAWREAHK